MAFNKTWDVLNQYIYVLSMKMNLKVVTDEFPIDYMFSMGPHLFPFKSNT